MSLWWAPLIAPLSACCSSNDALLTVDCSCASQELKKTRVLFVGRAK